MRTLYVIRGLPGSGKTTLALKLTDMVFEADQFFTRKGVYTFEASKLGAAHAQCQGHVRTAMLAGAPTIAVANTFTQQWEMDPYRQLATAHGYTVVEVTMSGPLWPNVHGVPAEAIARMRDRWERTTDSMATTELQATTRMER